MTRTPLPLGRKAGKSQAPMESVERLVNGYLASEPTGKEPTPVYGTPGLVLWCSGLNGAVRGVLEMTGTAYVVAGTHLYSINSSGTATDRGSIPNTDLVSMAGDGTNVVIVTNGDIYVWNGATLAIVTDPDAPDAASVIWTDGYFLFGIRNSQEFAISALADPTAYDALDFAAAEWKPDTLVAPVLIHRTVYMMGKTTIEAQQNTGGADFPFSRYEGVYVGVGLVGRDAQVVSNDQLFWMAQDGTFRRLDGLTATVISDAYVSRIVKGWADQTLTVASSHVIDDHLFIVFRNPDGCVAFDQSTSLWHERLSYGLTTWRVRHLFDCYGLTLAGSATEGKIYKLDVDAYDENGAALEFEMVTPYAYAGNKRLTFNGLEVVAQMGVGSLTLNPRISIEKTTNGRTWGIQRFRRMGKIGRDAETIQFGPQGQGRAMAFRVRITDPVQRAIFGIYADVDAEAA